MCLFDGFRLPSIRRLTRKPQTICFSPLVNYDPSFAPVTDTIYNIYMELLTRARRGRDTQELSCVQAIDPTTREVGDMLSKVMHRSLNERIIIHYFGQGSLPPSNGQLYFFNSQHNNYRKMPLESVVGSSASPVILIIDVDNAGSLAKYIEELNHKGQNIVAFMSCSEDEKLPAAPSLPLDILSSSILLPLESAIWFHSVKNLLKNAKNDIPKEAQHFIKGFLYSIIDAVALSTFELSLYEELMVDDIILKTFTRGFILSARFLNFFNVHNCSVPKIPYTLDSDIWDYWDLILDFVLSQKEFDINNSKMIFNQLFTTFQNFPTISYLPILCYLMQIPNFTEISSNIIYMIFEKMQSKIPIFIKKQIIEDIFKIDFLADYHYLILSKLFLEAIQGISDLDELILTIINKRYEIIPDILSSICYNVVLMKQSNQEKLIELCFKYIDEFQLFSLILIIFLFEQRSVENCATFSKFINTFISNENSEIRLASVFILGYIHDSSTLPLLINALNDKSNYVRSEALNSLVLSLKIDSKKTQIEECVLNKLKEQIQISEKDPDAHFQILFKKHKDKIMNFIKTQEVLQKGITIKSFHLSSPFSRFGENKE